MFRRLVLVIVSTVALTVGAVLASGAANAATLTSACPGDIAIEQFAFNPPSVPVGQTSTLNLVAQNCTNQTLTGQTIWFGKFTWANGGIPPGCPAIDPIAYPYTIPPQGTYTTSQGEADNFSGCQATGLQITVEFTDNITTGTAAEATATLGIIQPTPPPATCQVSYTPGNWTGGFTASITISNTGTATISGWTLTFAFPGDEEITSAWNAAVTQTGSDVTAANESYNGTIAPGGSQTFGVQGTWVSDDAPPAGFTVNGTVCS